MELNNEFTVDVPIERAWAVLTDVETIAPCLPGAQLQEIEGEEFRGIVKVKVGPITAQYKGQATFVEQDEAAGRVVLRGEGRDTKGQGNASALITAQLIAVTPEQTKVTVTTDLTVTGKVAQFGRGVMADVSGKLMNQFADNLAALVLQPAGSAAVETPAESPAAAVESPGQAAVTPSAPVHSGNGSGPTNEQATTPAAATPGVRKLDLPDPEPIDLMDAAGSSVMKRALPAVGLLALIILILRMLRSQK